MINVFLFSLNLITKLWAMRRFLIMTVLGLIFLGCNSAVDKKAEPIDGQGPVAEMEQMDESEYREDSGQIEQVVGDKFFDYDAIDYYFNDYPETDVDNLFDNRLRSVLDSLKMGVIVGETPKDISDLGFVKKLKEIGYVKRAINKKDFREIDDVFVEKSGAIDMAADCIYVYRDILIFKKQKKIIGTVKLCFDCNDFQIQGTSANTHHFGQYRDFERLQVLLRE
jgi:hypothetical protein